MEIRLIDIKKTILSDNQDLADQIRSRLRASKVSMLNLMSSPGAGKTSLILETVRRLKDQLRIGVIEGDIESVVDSEKMIAAGIPAVQLRTGGECHLDAPMVEEALKAIDLSTLDMIIVENVGNLVCPAEFDTGASLKVMILSVPEGDDKVLKYPLMFSVCDALVVNKMDYLSMSDFDMTVLRERAMKLNPRIRMFETSCKSGEGLDDWCRWLAGEVSAAIGLGEVNREHVD
jgi:hydrogenase nickel incorporation protein HypB